MVRVRSSNLLGKITLFFIICCLVIVGLCVNTAAALPGSGTQEDPWLIQSLEDFNDFAADANYWAGFTRLETDVNLAGMVYERAVIAPDVNSLEIHFQGTDFRGVFDGNDHKFTNLTINGGAGNDYLGLFGFMIYGEVRNLGLEGGSVSGNHCVGGLVGTSFSRVSNCYSTSKVSGIVEVGGLVGSNMSRLSNCYSASKVSGIVEVGGLVGYNIYGSISNCYSTGDVNGTASSVGGLVGNNYEGNIYNCYSTGDVNGTASGVGGLVGSISGSYNNVFNCYSTGDVNGLGDVGGIVGTNWDVVSNCFWDTDKQTHGVIESIGYNDGTATNVAGLPTAQMQTMSTFSLANWDFVEIWNIGENQTYPYLRVYLPSDINKDGIVNFLDLSITANKWMEDVE